MIRIGVGQLQIRPDVSVWEGDRILVSRSSISGLDGIREEARMRYGFIKTYKPVMDDAKYRSFDTMADYRKWCEENLPSWLGYGRL